MRAASPLKVHRAGQTLHLTLARPAARNALDGALVAALTDALRALPAGVRRVVLAGEGPAFCAGADLNWMVGDAAAGPAGPTRARALAALFAALDTAPVTVIGHGHGAVMGGGVGLLACCDLVVVEAGCRLALSEVRLGLVPAVIAPYVQAKVGVSTMRRMCVTACAIDAEEAVRVGLAHHRAADSEAARAHIEGAWGRALDVCAPEAVAEAKALVREVGEVPQALLPERLEARLARRLASKEAQSGVAAFRAKRAPPWTDASL